MCMGIDPIMDSNTWAAVPFHFWSLVFFCFGCIVGSFLNVVIHRMPLGESVVTPPSHCPHCKYSIPWYLNVPLVTWLWLRGRCRNCGAPISIRYFLVELLTGTTFLGCWLVFGHESVLMTLVYCLVLAGLIAATFIDIEHIIIPDEITIGGMLAGVVCSLIVPRLHGQSTMVGGLVQGLLGLGAGAGLIYFIVRGGKLVFGRQRVVFAEESRVVFTETAVHLPDQVVPYEEVFYRRSDTIALEGRYVELADRCYKEAVVRLAPERLRIDEEEFDPETVPHLEALSHKIILPREAMGFGDVKFMGAIGAFLGWQSVFFSLMASSIIGAVVGITLILSGKREWSSRLPYGPYIAMAAAIWIFGGPGLQAWWGAQLAMIRQIATGSF